MTNTETSCCAPAATTTEISAAERMQLRAGLIERIGGYMTSHAIGVAAELRLADHIGDGPATSESLAAAVGAHEPSLRRLLRTLTAVGIAAEPEPGHFTLTPVGAQLRTDSHDSLHAFARMFCHPTLFTSWQGLEQSVRTGERAFDHVYGATFYDHLTAHDEVSTLFNVAMGEESRIAAQQLADLPDFDRVKTVVDLGGGDGTLLAAVLRGRPDLRGIVFDSPSGVAEAPDVLAEAGVGDRCEVRAGDFFADIPDGGDLYVIKSVFQDWGDAESTALLRTCREQMPPSATLMIVGTILPETADTDTPVMFFTDLNMMVNTGGRERSESEFRIMLNDAGFDVRDVRIGGAGPLSLIDATPRS